MSPFPPAKQGDLIWNKDNLHGEEVECTQPFTKAKYPHNTGLILSYEEKKALELARAFYDRVGMHERHLSEVDIRTATYIRNHYNRKHRRKALDALLAYYEKKHRRRKIRGIGILRFYCEHLDTIKTGLKFDRKVAQRRSKQTKKRGWQEYQIKENHNQELKRIEQAQQKIIQNPWDSWSRAELRMPLYPTDKEISEWKQRCPDPPSSAVISNAEPTMLVSQDGPSESSSPNFCYDWDRAMNRLREKLFKISFNTWIRPLTPHSRRGDTWMIRAPSGFMAKWVEENYLDDLVWALGANVCILGCTPSPRQKGDGSDGLIT